MCIPNIFLILNVASHCPQEVTETPQNLYSYFGNVTNRREPLERMYILFHNHNYHILIIFTIICEAKSRVKINLLMSSLSNVVVF